MGMGAVMWGRFDACAWTLGESEDAGAKAAVGIVLKLLSVMG
jgi:hypothetical protein